MPPFQVIQEPPKPDPVTGFMQGFSWGQGVIDQIQERQIRRQQADLYRRHMEQTLSADQFKLFQMKDITQRRQIADQKVAEVINRAVSEKWDTTKTMAELTKVRDFTETEMGGLYAKEWVAMNDPYRQAQIKSMNALADWREQGGYLKKDMPEYWIRLGYSPEDAQILADDSAQVGAGLKPRATMAGSKLTPDTPEYWEKIEPGQPPEYYQNKAKQSAEMKVGFTPRAKAPSYKLLSYLDKDGKLQYTQYTPETFETVKKQVRDSGGNFETHKVTGDTPEKRLAYWQNVRNRTLDDLGEVPDDDTPENKATRDYSVEQMQVALDEIKARGGKPATKEQPKPETTQKPVPTTEEAKELTDAQLDSFVAEARRKLGKYATPANLKSFAMQLARNAGYKVD